MRFACDAARREHFAVLLRERLKDPAFRKQPGFPLGDDDDILRMSDPPYYTACPNPFLGDFMRLHGKPYDPNQKYQRPPYGADVSEGKTDALYTAHGYHTKVPYKAIVRAILHYTEPGDIVLDAFCGSGMTGVAAQICGALDSELKQAVTSERRLAEQPPPAWGARRVILNDLSPAATFIAANYNLPFDVHEFQTEARRILDEVQEEIGWMYETTDAVGRKGQIEYTVWSEVFSCPNCSGDIVFTEEALDESTKRVKETFPCPHCSLQLSRPQLERSYETVVDTVLNKTIQRPKRRPVKIVYEFGGKTFEKAPDKQDLAVLSKIDGMAPHLGIPSIEIPYMHMTHERAKMSAVGITHIHHFFMPRAAQSLGRMWTKAQAITDDRTRQAIVWTIEQAIVGMSVLARYVPGHYSQVNQHLSGVYYVAAQHSECSPWYILDGKLKRLTAPLARAGRIYPEHAIINTGTAASLTIPDQSIDYIYTDPPFGENLYYADLNFMVESFHRVVTDTTPEAIVDQAKRKGLTEYQTLMEACFREYCRVLKPGRWMTVVFHNSRNAVWNAIQEAMLHAGFVVADVRTLDKKQGSYRQVTSTAVKQDLIISAYRPNGGLEQRFALSKGTEEGVWDFVRTHLDRLPIPLGKGSSMQPVAERHVNKIYDRMVAFHVERAATWPYTPAQFRAELPNRFTPRDDMFFLPEQVAEYDRRRLAFPDVEQLPFAPQDESSTVRWLRRELELHPQTLQDLNPKYMKAQGEWGKYEPRRELKGILDEYFLCYEGEGPVPKQLWSWMQKSSTLRPKLEGSKPDAAPAAIKRHAKDRWYVPDPNEDIDCERRRERVLLKEFEQYRSAPSRKLKQFRIEAVRAGFRRAWGEKDYAQILEVAKKLPEESLEGDDQLYRWYKNALTRTEGSP
jgi:DNA modification methylase